MIGGGVIGCSILSHLTKLGWSDVVLVEREIGARTLRAFLAGAHKDPHRDRPERVLGQAGDGVRR